jgi:hypothetical protein
MREWAWQQFSCAIDFLRRAGVVRWGGCVCVWPGLVRSYNLDRGTCALGRIVETSSFFRGRRGRLRYPLYMPWRSRTQTSHELIAHATKTNTKHLCRHLSFDPSRRHEYSHSSKPLQQQSQTNTRIWQPRSPTPMGFPPPLPAQQTSSPIIASVHS